MTGDKHAHIAFSGHARDHLGIAMWQADGSGPEPAATGHTFVTPLQPITAHYYIASRDYGGIDPAARGALQARAPVRGFPRFAAALGQLGYRPDALVVRLPLITPGEDREGRDWTYRDGVETRRLHLAGGVRLELAGESFMTLPVPLLVLTEDYRGAREFDDVRLSLMSEPFVPRLGADVTRPELRAAGQALLADLNRASLRFVAESVVLLPQTFSGNGRIDGRFGEIPAARMEAVAG